MGQPYANGSRARANQEGRLPLQRSELPLNHEEERARERDGERASDSERGEGESEGRSEREARETGRKRDASQAAIESDFLRRVGDKDVI